MIMKFWHCLLQPPFPGASCDGVRERAWRKMRLIEFNGIGLVKSNIFGVSIYCLLNCDKRNGWPKVLNKQILRVEWSIKKQKNKTSAKKIEFEREKKIGIAIKNIFVTLSEREKRINFSLDRTLNGLNGFLTKILPYFDLYTTSIAAIVRYNQTAFQPDYLELGTI